MRKFELRGVKKIGEIEKIVEEGRLETELERFQYITIQSWRQPKTSEKKPFQTTRPSEKKFFSSNLLMCSFNLGFFWLDEKHEDVLKYLAKRIWRFAISMFLKNKTLLSNFLLKKVKMF